MAEARYRLMFVCSGNTCRSPMAEHVLRHYLTEAGLADALDAGHEELLRAAAPDDVAAAKVAVLRSFDPAAGGALDVPDPVRGAAGYKHVLRLTEAAMPGLMTAIRGGLAR